MFNILLNFYRKFAKNSEHISKERNLESYIISEIENSAFFKKEKMQLIMDHLINNKDIFKTQNMVSVNKKKLLGIHAKTIISEEFLSILTDKALEVSNPKILLNELYYKASVKKARNDELERLRTSRVFSEVKLQGCGNDADCSWCQSMQKEFFSIELNLTELIEKNCVCEPYCKCALLPKVFE